jgi:hypothetical protein
MGILRPMHYLPTSGLEVTTSPPSLPTPLQFDRFLLLLPSKIFLWT